jgi:hypothetical protein
MGYSFDRENIVVGVFSTALWWCWELPFTDTVARYGFERLHLSEYD